MITKNVSTEYGIVSTTAEVTRADNGQTIIRIVAKLGSATHEHKTTVGAKDGNDAVSALTEAELQASIQKHLDDERNKAAQVLAGRARVAKVSAKLA